MPTNTPSFLARAARHLLATAAIAGACVALAAGAAAQERVPLFKIVTVRDDIVVGVDAKDAGALGGSDVTALGRTLRDKGEVTLWQYAVRKAADGELEEAPVRRVSILGHDSLRVEPYATRLRVVAPQ